MSQLLQDSPTPIGSPAARRPDPLEAPHNVCPSPTRQAVLDTLAEDSRIADDVFARDVASYASQPRPRRGAATELAIAARTSPLGYATGEVMGSYHAAVLEAERSRSRAEASRGQRDAARTALGNGHRAARAAALLEKAGAPVREGAEA